jgi:hypothetical protein
MKKAMCLILLFLFMPMVLKADRIILKNKKIINGKVVKIVEKGFVVKTVEGSVIVIPQNTIAQIHRGNKIIDFETGMSYRIDTRRPFLPFFVLGVASGAYSVKRFGDYQDIHKKYGSVPGDSETKNTNDSKKAMAEGIVSGLLSAGSFFVALRPVEVRVPIGKIKISAVPNGVQLTLHF